MSPNAGGEGGVAGSQLMSRTVHRSPNKLWRSNSIFNLWSDRMGKLSLSVNFLSFFKMEINSEIINDDICFLFYFSFNL
jgi:hypothetical protein